MGTDEERAGRSAVGSLLVRQNPLFVAKNSPFVRLERAAPGVRVHLAACRADDSQPLEVRQGRGLDVAARLRTQIAEMLKRSLDFIVAALVLTLLFPLVLIVGIAIKIDSRGPVFYRCRRVGYGGMPLEMLKFRKMHVEAAGGALTSPDDERFTRIGALLARTKLDELPQLWNVLKGEMSLVGPRPEDSSFVALCRSDFDEILTVKPGVTGLSQLAFARESEVINGDDRYDDYVSRFLPAKVAIDRLYVRRRSFSLDLKILTWTAAAVLLRREVAVHRDTGRLNRRRRTGPATQPAGSTA